MEDFQGGLNLILGVDHTPTGAIIPDEYFSSEWRPEGTKNTFHVYSGLGENDKAYFEPWLEWLTGTVPYIDPDPQPKPDTPVPSGNAKELWATCVEQNKALREGVNAYKLWKTSVTAKKAKAKANQSV